MPRLCGTSDNCGVLELLDLSCSVGQWRGRRADRDVVGKPDQLYLFVQFFVPTTCKNNLGISHNHAGDVLKTLGTPVHPPERYKLPLSLGNFRVRGGLHERPENRMRPIVANPDLRRVPILTLLHCANAH